MKDVVGHDPLPGPGGGAGGDAAPDLTAVMAALDRLGLGLDDLGLAGSRLEGDDLAAAVVGVLEETFFDDGDLADAVLEALDELTLGGFAHDAVTLGRVRRARRRARAAGALVGVVLSVTLLWADAVAADRITDARAGDHDEQVEADATAAFGEHVAFDDGTTVTCAAPRATTAPDTTVAGTTVADAGPRLSVTCSVQYTGDRTYELDLLQVGATAGGTVVQESYESERPVGLLRPGGSVSWTTRFEVVSAQDPTVVLELDFTRTAVFAD